MTASPTYSCPKCRHDQYDTGQFRATGGNFAKIFDVQNRKFNTVTCALCGYTEIYLQDSSRLGNIIDFFVGR